MDVPHALHYWFSHHNTQRPRTFLLPQPFYLHHLSFPHKLPHGKLPDISHYWNFHKKSSLPASYYPHNLIQRHPSDNILRLLYNFPHLKYLYQLVNKNGMPTMNSQIYLLSNCHDMPDHRHNQLLKEHSVKQFPVFMSYRNNSRIMR